MHAALSFPPADYRKSWQCLISITCVKRSEVLRDTRLLFGDIATDYPLVDQLPETLIHCLHTHGLSGLDGRVHLRHLVLADEVANSRRRPHDLMRRYAAAGRALE